MPVDASGCMAPRLAVSMQMFPLDMVSYILKNTSTYGFSWSIWLDDSAHVALAIRPRPKRSESEFYAYVFRIIRYM